MWEGSEGVEGDGRECLKLASDCYPYLSRWLGGWVDGWQVVERIGTKASHLLWQKLTKDLGYICNSFPQTINITSVD